MYAKKGRDGQDLQLPLDDQCAGTDNPPGVLNDNDEVVAVLPPDPLEALGELGLCEVADGGQDAQAVEEAVVIVGYAQGAEGVARGQGSGDVAGEQVGVEEAWIC